MIPLGKAVFRQNIKNWETNTNQAVLPAAFLL